MNDINAAFKKDLEADTAYLNGVLYDPFALLYNDDIFMILLMTRIRFTALILLNISEKSILRIMSAKFN